MANDASSLGREDQELLASKHPMLAQLVNQCALNERSGG